jgi:DNA-3-methyladenine glycosylase I
MTSSERRRCPWCWTDPVYVRYHDEEWGRPVFDDRTFHEFLILEGAQAGLSWITILKRRDGYRAAFAGFDPVTVAAFTDRDAERLLADPGIIRNRAKIAAAIANARVFLAIQAEFGSFTDYLWAWTAGERVVNRPGSMRDVPARTELADAISADLRARGMRFVGPTIVYAFLQATGIVDDHLVDCWVRTEGI